MSLTQEVKQKAKEAGFDLKNLFTIFPFPERKFSLNRYFVAF